MKYLLLYNPVSGKSKFYKSIPFIEKFFEEKKLSLDIYCSKDIHDLEKVSFERAKNYDTILISGGDGTVNEVLNGIMKSDARPNLAILPSGTANDIAAILGLNKNIKRNLNNIINSKPVKIDVNMLNDRYFLYTTAAGILTKISYNIERKQLKKLGYIAYLLEGYKDIFNKYKMHLKIEFEEGYIEGEYLLVLGLSANRVAGINLNKFAKSKLDDGKFELTLFKYTKLFRVSRVLSFFLRRGKKAREDITISSSFYKITTTNDVVWNTDGEKALSGSVNIKVLNEEISVYVGKKAFSKFFTSK